MAQIKSFRAIRPVEAKAAEIAALPYDVYNRQEAKAAVGGHPKSFLNIDRPETQFPDGYDMYAPEAYEKARDMIRGMIEGGDFVQDEKPGYYLYELTMNGRSQTGIVACAAIDDYRK